MKHPEPGEHKHEGHAGHERDWGKHLKEGTKHLEHHHKEEHREVDHRHREPHKSHGGVR